eukprot:12538826-Alexandrium_andersonii.AAC.1
MARGLVAAGPAGPTRRSKDGASSSRIDWLCVPAGADAAMEVCASWRPALSDHACLTTCPATAAR